MRSENPHSGTGLSLAGIGVGIAIYVAEKIGLDLPGFVLIVLGIASVAMTVGGVVLVYRERQAVSGDTAQPRGGSGIKWVRSSGRIVRPKIRGYDTGVHIENSPEVEVEDAEIEV